MPRRVRWTALTLCLLAGGRLLAAAPLDCPIAAAVPVTVEPTEIVSAESPPLELTWERPALYVLYCLRGRCQPARRGAIAESLNLPLGWLPDDGRCYGLAVELAGLFRTDHGIQNDCDGNGTYECCGGRTHRLAGAALVTDWWEADGP